MWSNGCPMWVKLNHETGECQEFRVWSGLTSSFRSSFFLQNDDACGRFYEPACQVSSLVVAASDLQRQTSSERAQAPQPARGCARERVFTPTVSSSALSPRG